MNTVWDSMPPEKREEVEKYMADLGGPEDVSQGDQNEHDSESDGRGQYDQNRNVGEAISRLAGHDMGDHEGNDEEHIDERSPDFYGIEQERRHELQREALSETVRDLVLEFNDTSKVWPIVQSLGRMYEGRDKNSTIRHSIEEVAREVTTLNLNGCRIGIPSYELLNVASRLNGGNEDATTRIAVDAVSDALSSGEGLSSYLNELVYKYDIDTTSEDFKKAAKLGAVRALNKHHKPERAAFLLSIGKIPVDEDLNYAAHQCTEYLEGRGRPLASIYKNFQPNAEKTDYIRSLDRLDEVPAAEISDDKFWDWKEEEKEFYLEYKNELLQKTKEHLRRQAAKPYMEGCADIADEIEELQEEEESNSKESIYLLGDGEVANLTEEEKARMLDDLWKRFRIDRRDIPRQKYSEDDDGQVPQEEILTEDGRAPWRMHEIQEASLERRIDLAEFAAAKLHVLDELYHEYEDEGALMFVADFRVTHRTSKKINGKQKAEVTPYTCVIFPHPNGKGWAAVGECLAKEGTATYATYLEVLDANQLADSETCVDKIVDLLKGGKDEARKRGNVWQFRHTRATGFALGKDKYKTALGNNARVEPAHIEKCIQSIPSKKKIMDKRQKEHEDSQAE